jgi:hypothetical protein
MNIKTYSVHVHVHVSWLKATIPIERRQFSGQYGEPFSRVNEGPKDKLLNIILS